MTPANVRTGAQSEDGKANRPDDSAQRAGAGGQSHSIGVSREAKVVRKQVRREVLASALGALLLAFCISVEAQQTGKIPRIGFLSGGFPGSTIGIERIRRELRELGYVEGKNIAFDYRYAEDKPERSPSDAARLKGS